LIPVAVEKIRRAFMTATNQSCALGDSGPKNIRSPNETKKEVMRAVVSLATLFGDSPSKNEPTTFAATVTARLEPARGGGKTLGSEEVVRC
jgi:hypothetical protein